MRRILIGLTALLTTLTLPLTVWFSWEGENLFKSLVKEFSKETGIDVKVVYVPKNVDEKLLMAWKARAGIPDAVLLKNDEVGRLLDILEPLAPSKDLSRKSISAFTVNGKLLAEPVYLDIGGVFFYRGSIPNAKSVENLVELLKSRKNALMIPVYGKYYFQVFQRAFGQSTDLYLKDQSTLETLEYLIWMKKEIPYLPKDGRSAIGFFMRGTAKVLMFGSFLIPKFLEKGFEFGIMKPPFVERAGKRISPNLDYKGFSVVKGRLSREVKEFLNYVSSKKFQTSFCKPLYKIPSNTKAMATLSSKPLFKELLEYENYGQPTPTNPDSRKYYEAINTMLRLMMRGVEDPEALIEAGKKVLSGK